MRSLGASGLTEMIKRRLSGYSRLILLLGIVLIAGLWSLVSYQISYDYRRTVAESSTETMNLATAFEEHVRRILIDADKELLNLKQIYERDGIASPVIDTYLAIAGNDPCRTQVTVVNERGVQLASFDKRGLGMNISDREYFSFHRDNPAKSLYIGKPIISRTTGENSVTLSRRIDRPDGSFGGIVVIGLKTGYFLSFYQQINLGQNQLVTLSDLGGYRIARQAGDAADSSLTARRGELWNNLQTGRSHGTYYSPSTIDGVSRFISYRVMPDYPLAVAVGVSTRVALAPFEQRRLGQILAASLASLLLLALFGLLIDRMEKQRTLNARLEEMVDERTTEVEAQREELQAQNEELRAKEDELSRINRKLLETNSIVEQEKDRLAALISSISDEVWFADTKKQLTLVNPAVLREFNLQPDVTDIEKIAASFEVLRPDGSPRPVEEAPPLRALLGEAIRDELELVRTPASGELRYREVSANPVRDSTGEIIGSVSTVRDVTDRKRREVQLAYFAEEAAATNSELKAFANTIAHDFRSPMVNLKGFSAELGYSLAELRKILEDSGTLPPEARAKVDELLDQEIPDAQRFIEVAVDRLNRMVDALLNLSRVGRRELNIEEVDLGNLVSTVFQSYQHQLGEKNSEVRVGVLPTLQTDRLTLEQIVGNLVDNAVKYLEPDRWGIIAVSCSETDHEYVVRVEDNGRGIAAIDHEKIFEPFRRSGKQDQPGEGLGLAYVRALVRQLGGKVWCESEIGVGTTMNFTIPKRRG